MMIAFLMSVGEGLTSCQHRGDVGGKVAELVLVEKCSWVSSAWQQKLVTFTDDITRRKSLDGKEKETRDAPLGATGGNLTSRV